MWYVASVPLAREPGQDLATSRFNGGNGVKRAAEHALSSCVSVDVCGCICAYLVEVGDELAAEMLNVVCASFL